MTPNGMARSPYGRVGLAPLEPPSPDAVLSSNLDCAFPPFPTKKPTANAKSTAKGGSNLRVEPDPASLAPLSPRSVSAGGPANGGLLKRMNTIAPGPFDVRGRQGSLAERPKEQQQEVVSNGMQGLSIASTSPETKPPIPRPSTSMSTRSRGVDEVEPLRPRTPRTNGYGGFGAPSPEKESKELEEPKMLATRAQTFPVKSQEPAPPVRRPTDLAATSMRRRPSKDLGFDMPVSNGSSVTRSPPKGMRPPTSGPDTSRTPPPRSPSVSGRPGAHTGINLDAEFGAANPYHTPSISQSSNDSEYSHGSKASSRSSPPSTSPQRPRRPSLALKVEESRPNFQPMNPPTIAPPVQVESPIKEQFANPMRDPDSSFVALESPMDPAIQPGLDHTPHPPLARPPPPLRSQTVPLPRPAPAPERPVRSSTAKSKGNCKACRQPITGRSVSSADGRLTGRYHKDCFVCTTCAEPFNSTTFYVLNDAPYCERHYHKLNGSICAGCDKGIEGQYLENERRQKFHPGCLKCMDCGRVLKHDYFEMNNRVYCERDAFRRAQQGRFLGVGGPGGGLGGATNRMERRTTRLMMM